MIRQMVLVFIRELGRSLSIKATGRMISSMGKDGNCGKIKVNILEITICQRRMAKVCMCGLMAILISVPGKITRSLAHWVSTVGQTDVSTVVSGSLI